MLWNSIFADLYCSAVNFAVIACKTEKVAAPPGFLWWPLCHTCVMSFPSEKFREKCSDLSPSYCVKKWMLQHSTRLAVMAHKSGQFWWNYKTTRRNFGDSVRIYDSSPPPRKCYPVAEFLLRTQGIGGKYHQRQRQSANVASLSSALTISTFACCLSPGDIRGELERIFS